MRKQCLKKQDIHRALIEKGFTISYSSVCKYIQQRKVEKSKKPMDVFVKQYYEPGDEFLDKICLNYARNNIFMYSSQEKYVSLQDNKRYIQLEWN